jgi:hypothetical protein
MIPPLSEEANVDDIPFNTGVIAGTTSDHLSFIKIWDVTEETEVQDIPFNTASVLAEYAILPDMLAMEEEAYVDDIPFNTYKIYTDCCICNMCSNMEEEYVDDIPFSTAKMYSDWKLDNRTEFMAEEVNSDDIPFNTSDLAAESLFEEIVMKNYTDESNVSDIPFSTSVVAANDGMEHLFADYFDEQNVEDVPFDTREIYCEHRYCPIVKVRFSKDISSVSSSFRESMGVKDMQDEGLDYIEYMDIIMENIEESWLSGKALYSAEKKKLIKYSPLTIDL